MDQNNLNIRILATIRTDLAMKKAALENIRQQYWGADAQDGDQFEHRIFCVISSLDVAIHNLNDAIDRRNELSRQASMGMEKDDVQKG